MFKSSKLEKMYKELEEKNAFDIFLKKKMNEKTNKKVKELLEKGAFDNIQEKSIISIKTLQEELQIQKSINADLKEQIDFLKLQKKYNNIKQSNIQKSINADLKEQKDFLNLQKKYNNIKQSNKSKSKKDTLAYMDYRANNKLLLWSLFNPLFMAIGMILLGIGNTLLLGAYIMLWLSYAVFNVIRYLGKMIYSII